MILQRTSLVAIFVFSLAGRLSAINEPVIFDVPAAVQAVEAAGEKPDLLGADKIIQVTVPVSAQISKQNRGAVDEFRFDIFWNRSVYPLVDYEPRTATASVIAGNIAVETRTDRNASLGMKFSGGYPEFGQLSAHADIGKRQSEARRYEEVPQFDVLVASGSIHRGTGVFFRLHPSKQETLEGGRDLVVAFRVPNSWRGGVLQVQCRATGSRRVFAGWADEFEVARSFVIPVYLQGDDQARTLATKFVRSEQDLRKSWLDHDLPGREGANGLASLFSSRSGDGLPDQWVHQLIQSGTDTVFDRYAQRLPDGLRETAREFVDIRRELLLLSR